MFYWNKDKELVESIISGQKFGKIDGIINVAALWRDTRPLAALGGPGGGTDASTGAAIRGPGCPSTFAAGPIRAEAALVHGVGPACHRQRPDSAGEPIPRAVANAAAITFFIHVS